MHFREFMRYINPAYHFLYDKSNSVGVEKKSMTQNNHLKGILSPVYTPFHEDYSLNLAAIPEFVEYLIRNRFAGTFINGTTGEFTSLTLLERKQVAEAYINAISGRIPAIVNCGTCCGADTRDLIAHAVANGADGVCVIAPFYLRAATERDLADFIKSVACECHDTPLWLYHAPGMTHCNLSMVKLLSILIDEVPQFAGVKYTNENLYEFCRCAALSPKIQMLMGRDEMLLGALAMGAKAGIGTTYNYLPRIYNHIIDAFDSGNLAEAQQYTGLAHQVIAISGEFGLPAIKTLIKLAGLDMGPMRLPVARQTPEEELLLRQKLTDAKLMDWIG